MLSTKLQGVIYQTTTCLQFTALTNVKSHICLIMRQLLRHGCVADCLNQGTWTLSRLQSAHAETYILTYAVAVWWKAAGIQSAEGVSMAVEHSHQTLLLVWSEKQSYYSPWGFRDVEAPTYQDNRHRKVVRSPLPPGNIPGTHFC